MTQVFDGTVSGNSSSTTSAFGVHGASDIVGYFAGDAESTDLTIIAQVRHEDGGTWHEFETDANTDLTFANEPNARAFPYDVAGASHKMRFKLVNNTADDTDVTVNVGKQQNL